MLAASAPAASTEIEYVNLSANDRTWDFGDSEYGCLITDDDGYSPASEASLGSQNDAFDGGLILAADRPFSVAALHYAGAFGDLTGNQLRVGPVDFAGFKPLKLKPRKTGCLVIFADLNPTNESGAKAAKKFDKKKLNKQLLAGISKGVKKKILNWNL